MPPPRTRKEKEKAPVRDRAHPYYRSPTSATNSEENEEENVPIQPEVTAVANSSKSNEEQDGVNQEIDEEEESDSGEEGLQQAILESFGTSSSSQQRPISVPVPPVNKMPAFENPNLQKAILKKLLKSKVQELVSGSSSSQRTNACLNTKQQESAPPTISQPSQPFNSANFVLQSLLPTVVNTLNQLNNPEHRRLARRTLIQLLQQQEQGEEAATQQPSPSFTATATTAATVTPVDRNKQQEQQGQHSTRATTATTTTSTRANDDQLASNISSSDHQQAPSTNFNDSQESNISNSTSQPSSTSRKRSRSISSSSSDDEGRVATRPRLSSVAATALSSQSQPAQHPVNSNLITQEGSQEVPFEISSSSEESTEEEEGVGDQQVFQQRSPISISSSNHEEIVDEGQDVVEEEEDVEHAVGIRNRGYGTTSAPSVAIQSPSPGDEVEEESSPLSENNSSTPEIFQLNGSSTQEEQVVYRQQPSNLNNTIAAF